MATPVGFGIYAQRGINLLQVGALRIPCFMSSVASVTRIAEIALRLISKALDFLGFKGEAPFSKWITSGVDWVRPYKDETKYSTKKLLIEAIALAAIGVVGNSFVTLLFGPAPEIYNRVLQWVGPIRVSSDIHPLIQFAAQRL